MESLYRDVVIPYSDKQTGWSRMKILSQSRGLQYVRTLYIGNSNFYEVGLCKALDEFVPKLSVNSLTRFDYDANSRPTYETMQYLWKHQTNLTNLDLDFSLVEPTTAQIVKDDANTMRSLRSIRDLSIDFGSDPRTTMTEFRKFTKLLDFSKLREVKLVAPSDWESQENRDITARILKLALPISLTSITLFFMHTTAVKDLKLDRYHALKHLELHECYGTGSILEQSRHPQLTSLTIQCCIDEEIDTFEDIRQTNEFLLRFHTLKHLIYSFSIEISHQRMLDGLVNSIGAHTENLQSLIIDFIPSGLSGESISQIALRCRKLSELVIPIGNTPIEDQCKVSNSN